MIAPGLAHVLLPLIVSVSILLMLIRPRNIPEVYWITGGALLLILLRLVSLPLAGRGHHERVGRLPISDRHDACVGVGPRTRRL